LHLKFGFLFKNGQIIFRPTNFFPFLGTKESRERRESGEKEIQSSKTFKEEKRKGC
jgi:hypothetical protein